MYKDKAKSNEAAKERMRRYRQKGVTTGGVTEVGVTDKVLYFDNGSYIHINKLIDPKWRSLLEYLSKNMRYPDGLRVGMSGPTIAEIKPLLEATVTMVGRLNKALHRPQTLTS